MQNRKGEQKAVNYYQSDSRGPAKGLLSIPSYVLYSIQLCIYRLIDTNNWTQFKSVWFYLALFWLGEISWFSPPFIKMYLQYQFNFIYLNCNFFRFPECYCKFFRLILKYIDFILSGVIDTLSFIFIKIVPKICCLSVVFFFFFLWMRSFRISNLLSLVQKLFYFFSIF